MRKDSGYTSITSDVPFRGLATAVPATKLNPSFSPKLLNVLMRDGYVRKRAGGQQIGQQLVGRVLGITEFGELNASPSLVVLTKYRQYAFDEATSRFIDLTPNLVTHAVVDIDPAGTWFEIAGDHTADFTAGRLVPLDDNFGPNERVYTVASSSYDGGSMTTTVVVEEEIADPLTISGDLTIADDLTTEDGDFIDFVGVTDLNGRRFLMTNGRDPVRVWDGDTGNEFVDWAPTYTGFVTCKCFCVFAEHLFLGNVTTASNESQLIAWSNAGDFDEFETGTAGAQLLYQMDDGITRLKVLGDRLVVYSRDVIILAAYVGAPAYFAFEVVIPEGVRFASFGGVTSINVGHIYLAEESVYLFDGSRGLRVLGNPIYNDYKAVRDFSKLAEACCINDYSKRTIYFSVPDISGGVMTYTLFYDVYDLNNIVWSKEKYADDVTAWGFYTNREENLTWDDASWEAEDTPWENELGSWVEEGEQLGFPVRTYGTANGEVIIVTEAALNDRTTEVEQVYETKDFEVAEESQSIKPRWGEIEFEAEGGTVLISYSLDRGRTFSTPEEIELGTGLEVHTYPIDQTSRTLRVRFTTTNNFTISWIRVWHTEGAPR